MANAAEEMTEKERAQKTADALTRLGPNAGAEDTGGGIICVVIPRAEGGAIPWGTAYVTWGAVITNEDWGQVSSIGTEWPSNSEDVAASANILLEQSVRNGAIPRQT